jgi:hypothetical protein
MRNTKGSLAFEIVATQVLWLSVDCNTNFEAHRQECIRDANYVCGAITSPSVTRGCP